MLQPQNTAPLYRPASSRAESPLLHTDLSGASVAAHRSFTTVRLPLRVAAADKTTKPRPGMLQLDKRSGQGEGARSRLTKRPLLSAASARHCEQVARGIDDAELELLVTGELALAAVAGEKS